MPVSAHLSSSSGSSKNVKLVIRSDVDHIATSIGQLSVSRAPNTCVMLEARISAKDWESQGAGGRIEFFGVGSW